MCFLYLLTNEKQCVKLIDGDCMIQILLAAYNGERYIKQQLDSLFAQTVTDFELIVRDDCSTDGTFAILSEYEKKYPEKIRVYRNETPYGNAKDNFFRLMQDADADYILFCDQDDVWMPDKIEKTLAKMKMYPQNMPVLVHTDLSVADEHLNIKKSSFFKAQHFNVQNYSFGSTLAQNNVTGCTMMINRALLNLVKNTNNSDIIMHDWWLAAAAATFGKIGVVNEPTVLYRQHSKNAVGAKGFYSSFFKKLFHTGEAVGISDTLKRTFKQSTAFADAFSDRLRLDQISAILSYANLPNLPVSKRLRTVIKYGFLKQSLLKKTAMLLHICMPNM